MRYILSIFVLFAVACSGGKDVTPVSTGRPYEVFVIADQNTWDGVVGDTLRRVLQEFYPMLNQDEPTYDIFYVPTAQFKSLTQRHRNLIIVKSGSDYTEPKVSVRYNVYSDPQIVIDITAPNETSMAEYLGQHSSELIKLLDITERDRFVAKSKKFNDKELSDLIRTKFGFNMHIPTGYKIRNEESDFLWLSYEMPLVSQGLLIYSYTPTTTDAFSLSNLVARRNEFVSYVPGPSEGSYMTTTSAFEPDARGLKIHGRSWIELRGFWDVAGDYMGGPFVSYTTYDKPANKMITLDMYVMSPKYDKRNYVRQLESFVYTVSFPEVQK